MAREAKFLFTSEDHIGKTYKGDGIEYRVSLAVAKNTNKKTGKTQIQYNLYFSKDVIHIYDLKGKRLKFYLDADKKAVAWRVMDGQVTTLDDLSTGREVKPFGVGQWQTSITKLVNAAGIEIKEKRSAMPVKSYKTTELGIPMQYYYVTL